MKNTEKTIDFTSMTRAEIEQYAMEMSTKNQILEMQLQDMQAKMTWYREQLRLNRHKLFGASSEKTLPNQLSFFDEVETTADESVKEPEMVDVQPRKTAGRKKKGHKDRILRPLPKAKPIRYELTDEEKICDICGSELSPMKKEVRRTIIVIPEQHMVQDEIIHTYSCKHCEKHGTESRIVRAKAPAPLFRNSLASTSLLSDIIIKKYALSLPVYRQEQVLHANGINLSRQTMANWIIQSVEKYFQPLYDVMHSDLLTHDIINADETTLEVLNEPGKSASSPSYMWLYRTGSYETERPVILYEYQSSREGYHPAEFLKGAHGYLQTDGYSGYNEVIRENGLISVGCLSHVRRKYNDALKVVPAGADKKKSLAAVGLDYCNQLFAIEKKAKTEGLSAKERKELRDREARPVLEAFLSWAETKEPEVLGKSNLRKALVYTCNQAEYLRNYLKDGRLDISNNISELSIKSFVIGRKNWLFSNSQKGADSSAVIYSLVETAKACKLNLFNYFNYVLTEYTKNQQPDETTLRSWLPYSKSLPDQCYAPADDDKATDNI